jgi:molybdopterin-guanine dinucleotide biosynthesis protein A
MVEEPLILNEINYNQNMLTLVIQAGGESRRMGRDKGLLPFLGRTLIERILANLSPLADEWIVVTNHPERYRFLNLPLVSDVYPGRGALGGVYTALQFASQPLVAVVACDMPFANADLFSAEVDILRKDTGVDAAIPQNLQGLEPFHAVYRRETCLPAAKAALDGGLWRVDSWYSQVSLRLLPVTEVQKYDPDLLAFQNINTPDDLLHAEQVAASLSLGGSHDPEP